CARKDYYSNYGFDYW
nr:immunoglobulin heavy chain junction region [Mus musculus]